MYFEENKRCQWVKELMVRKQEDQRKRKKVNNMARGLYANIHARRASGKKMRKKGDKGAPTDAAFKKAKKTAKKK